MPPEEAEYKLKPTRILIIDDREEVRQELKELLEQGGFEAAHTGSPSRALDFLLSEKKHFDMVLTKHTLPDVEGIKLAELVQNELQGAPPFMLITDYERQTTTIRSLNAVGYKILGAISRDELNEFKETEKSIFLRKTINNTLDTYNRYFDHDTGLFNDFYFQKRLRNDVDDALRSESDLSIAMLSATASGPEVEEKIKSGPKLWSKILWCMARTLCCSAPSNLIARYKENEFIFEFMGTTMYEASKKFHALITNDDQWRSNILKKGVTDSQLLSKIHLSAGLADITTVSRQRDIATADLIMQARLAMNTAKKRCAETALFQYVSQEVGGVRYKP